MEFAQISHFPFPSLRKPNANCNCFQLSSLHSAESKLGCFSHTVHTPAAAGEQMGSALQPRGICAPGTKASGPGELRTGAGTVLPFAKKAMTFHRVFSSYGLASPGQGCYASCSPLQPHEENHRMFTLKGDQTLSHQIRSWVLQGYELDSQHHGGRRVPVSGHCSSRTLCGLRSTRANVLGLLCKLVESDTE